MPTCEALKFMLVGLVTVLIDFMVYRGLLFTQYVDITFAKAMGFLIGSAFAYFANQLWTFGQKQAVTGQVLRFIVLYFMTWMVNVLVNTTALFLLSDTSYTVLSAFVLATGVSACINFWGMKLWVFTESLTAKEFA